jgi:hypothetical protein
MFDSPEHTIATLALTGLCMFGLGYLVRWLFTGPTRPDPWDETISAQIESTDATPLCHRCVTIHSHAAHFCPNCGAAVGDYNNVLPFEQLFSEGEVFRNGTTQRFRPTFLVVCGYLLLSAAAYMIFAPVYWFFLLRNLSRPAAVSIGGTEPPPPPASQ